MKLGLCSPSLAPAGDAPHGKSRFVCCSVRSRYRRGEHSQGKIKLLISNYFDEMKHIDPDNAVKFYVRLEQREFVATRSNQDSRNREYCVLTANTRRNEKVNPFRRTIILSSGHARIPGAPSVASSKKGGPQFFFRLLDFFIVFLIAGSNEKSTAHSRCSSLLIKLPKFII